MSSSPGTAKLVAVLTVLGFLPLTLTMLLGAVWALTTAPDHEFFGKFGAALAAPGLVFLPWVGACAGVVLGRPWLRAARNAATFVLGCMSFLFAAGVVAGFAAEFALAAIFVGVIGYSAFTAFVFHRALVAATAQPA